MTREKLAARFSRLLPDLSATIADFPVPALIAFLLFLYVQLDIGGIVRDGSAAGNRVYLTGAAAFIASGAAHYFGRGRRYSRSEDVGLALVAAVGVGVVAYFERLTQVSFLFLLPGLVLVLMIAAFLRPGAQQGALWVVNLRLGLAALLASLAGIVFAAGLSAIAASLDFLFEAELPKNLYERVWAAAMSLVSPLYGLSLAPRDLAEEVDVDSPPDQQVARGVSVLVNYVLVPIVLVFAAILHAYAIKIAIAGVMPKNQIGWMVTAFALVGSGTWLVAWPWRERGSSLLRAFVGGWFALTIVPVILLAIAIGQRIAEFGITPDRYGIVVVAVWLISIAGYMAYRRRLADMRVILGTFAVLLLVGSAGRWGAHGITASDQFERLRNLLESTGALTADGRFVRPARGFARDEEKMVASIISTLGAANGLDRMRPLFEGNPEDPFRSPGAEMHASNEIARAMDVELWSGDRDYFYFNTNQPLVEYFEGSGRLVGPISLEDGDAWSGGGGISAAIENGILSIKLGGQANSIPEETLSKLSEVQERASGLPHPIALDDSTTAIITAAHGYREGSIHLTRVSLWLVLEEDSQ